MASSTEYPPNESEWNKNEKRKWLFVSGVVLISNRFQRHRFLYCLFRRMIGAHLCDFMLKFQPLFTVDDDDDDRKISMTQNSGGFYDYARGVTIPSHSQLKSNSIHNHFDKSLQSPWMRCHLWWTILVHFLFIWRIDVSRGIRTWRQILFFDVNSNWMRFQWDRRLRQVIRGRNGTPWVAFSAILHQIPHWLRSMEGSTAPIGHER